MRFVLGILFVASAFGQTGGALQPVPIQQPLDNAGRTLQGQCLYTYAAGTTTPQTTYSNRALSVPNTNPIILNGFGRQPAVYLSAVSYKIVLAYATTPGNCPVSPGTVIWSQDDVFDYGELLKVSMSGPTGAGQIGFQQVGGTATTVQAALRLCPDASQYSSLAVAIASVPSGGCLNCTSPFSVGSLITLSAQVHVYGNPGCVITASFNGAILNFTAGSDGSIVNGVTFQAGETANPTWNKPTIELSGVANVILDSITISDCVSTSTSGGNWGILAVNTPGLTVKNSTISCTGGNGGGDSAAGPIEVQASNNGQNSDNVRILNNLLENPSCAAGSGLCGNVFRAGKTANDTATISNLQFIGNTVKNGAGRMGYESWSAAHLMSNWASIKGGVTCNNTFIDEAPVFIEISLANNDGMNLCGNQFNHQGVNPGPYVIELGNGNYRSVTGNSEIQCGAAAISCQPSEYHH